MSFLSRLHGLSHKHHTYSTIRACLTLLIHIFYLSLQNPPGQELNAHGTSLTKRQAKKSERRKAATENGNGDEDDDDATNGTMNNSARLEIMINTLQG